MFYQSSLCFFPKQCCAILISNHDNKFNDREMTYLSLIISKIRVSKFTPWKFIFRWLASPAYKNDVWHSPSSLTILDKRKWRMLLTLIFKWEKGINTCLGRRGISWTNSQVTHSLWGIFQFFYHSWFKKWRKYLHWVKYLACPPYMVGRMIDTWHI